MAQPTFYVKDFMTKDVTAVKADTPLIAAANLLIKNNYTGLPVVDAENKLVGILTEHDLIAKGSVPYFSTFLKLIISYDLYRKDPSLINDEVREILSLEVSDVMNDDPFVLYPETNVEEAVRMFGEHHRINPIVIVDKKNHLIGVISRSDIVKFFTGSSLGGEYIKNATKLTDSEIKEFLSGLGRHFGQNRSSRIKFWFWFGIFLFFIAVGLITLFISFVFLKVVKF